MLFVGFPVYNDVHTPKKRQCGNNKMADRTVCALSLVPFSFAQRHYSALCVLEKQHSLHISIQMDSFLVLCAVHVLYVRMCVQLHCSWLTVLG